MAEYQTLTQDQMDQLIAERSRGKRIAHSQVAGPVSITNPNYDEIEDPRQNLSMPSESWVTEDGHVIQAIHQPDNTWIVVKDKAPDPDTNRPKNQPPPTTDRQGHHYVWDEGKADWIDFGPGSAPPTSEERTAQQAQEQEGWRITGTTYEGAGKTRVKVTTFANGQSRRDSDPDNAPSQPTKVTYGPNNEQITEYEGGRPPLVEQESPAAKRARETAERESKKPTFVPGAGDTQRNITFWNPTTGQMESGANPSYDEAKATAEQERQRIATEISQRRMSLDEGVEAYRQWFDQNVKMPFMQAEEARARATEQRQALDAEERRRQFASNFKLQKAELGQKAGAAAMQAEESLLPYRAGPTEAADMSAAINSLAAGGNPQGPSAAAGINFQASDFQFNAPDFKKIAAQATKAAIGGLTDYRPSEQQYSTADYNSQPIAVATPPPTMPTYSYPGTAPTVPINSQ